MALVKDTSQQSRVKHTYHVLKTEEGPCCLDMELFLLRVLVEALESTLVRS